MRYLIMIHSNPRFRALWEELPDEKKAEFGRSHLALDRALRESGELVHSDGLADPAEAKCVTVRGGKPLASDGPFAEVKEHLVGFYLVDCESMERALDIAARVPDAAYGKVEVRPVRNVKELDL
ncbi:YciI family protein [Amycolatopsis orientalis]|uniref:YciI family protein n=1 Tax=Amycolatopsis orientalis TaxID=31958 RepID=UPI0003A1A70D|nr:YciI family protein [Amycolatopsis orientalis]